MSRFIDTPAKPIVLLVLAMVLTSVVPSHAFGQDQYFKKRPSKFQTATMLLGRFFLERAVNGRTTKEAAARAIEGVVVDMLRRPGSNTSAAQRERLLGVKVVVDKQIKIVDGPSETLETIAGVKRKFTRSRTIQHATARIDTSSLRGSVGLDFNFINAKITGSVATSIGQTLTKSYTVEEQFEIDGDKVQQVRLVWCDRFRTGTVVIRTTRGTRTLPFELHVGTRLQIRSLEK